MKKLITMLIIISTAFLIFSGNVSADYYSEYKTIRYGDRNSHVYTLQNDLKYLGYSYYNSTGYFGSMTQNSVMAFQRRWGLAVDGIVGHQTAKEMKISKVLKMAKSYQGVPYAWGGQSPSGFDCSGFVHYVLLKNGVTIPRTTGDQYYSGTWVNKSNLRRGDLVFFTTYKSGPSHVGIYLGDGKFVHASSGAGKIIISDMNNSYYKSHYIGAKRIIK